MLEDMRLPSRGIAPIALTRPQTLSAAWFRFQRPGHILRGDALRIAEGH